MPPTAVKYTSVISIVGLQSLIKGSPSREREQLDQNKADSYIYYYFFGKRLEVVGKRPLDRHSHLSDDSQPHSYWWEAARVSLWFQGREIVCDQISRECRVSYIQPHGYHNYWLVY